MVTIVNILAIVAIIGVVAMVAMHSGHSSIKAHGHWDSSTLELQQLENSKINKSRLVGAGTQVPYSLKTAKMENKLNLNKTKLMATISYYG